MSNQFLTDEASAASFLAPFRDLLVESIRGAFADWSAVLAANPTETAGLGPRTQRSFIHERVVHRLRVAQMQGRVSGLRIMKIRGLLVAVFHDTLMLKLKKLNRELRSRNIPTGQTQAFDHQVPLIDATAPMTNATGGWVMDTAAAGPLHVVVVCWDSPHTLRWVVDLEDDGGSDGTLVELEAGPPPAPPRRRTKVAISAADAAAQ